jgi:hypothetical protein
LDVLVLVVPDALDFETVEKGANLAQLVGGEGDAGGIDRLADTGGLRLRVEEWSVMRERRGRLMGNTPNRGEG